jgi:hypothetical protein
MFPLPTEQLRAGRAVGEACGIRAGLHALSPTPASLGARLGDMAVIHMNAGVPASGSGEAFSAWMAGAVWWKILNADDLANPITTSGAGGVLAIYRGANSLVPIAFDQRGSPGSYSMAGVTPDAHHLGLFASILSSNDPSTFPAMTSPATWAGRATIQTYNKKIRFLDRLYPANAKYAGEALGFTQTATFDQFTIFEFRNA